MSDIRNIITELEQQRDAIEKAIAALRGIAGMSGISVAASKGVAPRKSQMSEEGRRRIAEATRKRWAAKRAEASAATKKTTRKQTAKKAGGKKASKKARRKQALATTAESNE